MNTKGRSTNDLDIKYAQVLYSLLPYYFRNTYLYSGKVTTTPDKLPINVNIVKLNIAPILLYKEVT